MNIKQILFLTIVLGFITNTTPTETNNHIPTYLHYEEFPSANDYCFISGVELQTITDRAERTLQTSSMRRSHIIGTLPDEKHKCRLLLVFVKDHDREQLKSAFEKAHQKYFK
jgi:hypothetical protein